MATQYGRYCRWNPSNLPGTLSIPPVMLAMTSNYLYLAMNRAYGGEVLEEYYCPPGPNGPFNLRVEYGLAGFDHSYSNADPEVDFDRVILTDGSVHFAWNILWQWSGFTRQRVTMLRSFWYLSPHVTARYRYLGRLTYVLNQGNYSAINTETFADPNPPPRLDPP